LRNPITLLAVLALGALGALGAATLLALLAPLGWPFELFAHFRPQYAVAALLVTLVLAGQRRGVAAGVAALLVAWNALPVVQRASANAPPASCDGPAFTVATVNLQYSNPQHGRLLAWLAGHPADVIVVQELTGAWAQALAGSGAHPHRFLLTREDPYGIGVLSRWPLESAGALDLAGDGLPSIAGIVDIEGRRVRLLGLHTHWPVLPEVARMRNAALGAAAGISRDSDLPVILLGDLNLTPDSPEFTRLLDESALRDVVNGRRWRPTWQAGFWPLALRIDHVLVSPQLCVEAVEVGPSIGSDHRPVIARLRLAR
jgi:endonuclease/exonuclease/phosphatase (EEP) superfamily protein YafD